MALDGSLGEVKMISWWGLVFAVSVNEEWLLVGFSMGKDSI